jgi:hypothetical protein
VSQRKSYGLLAATAGVLLAAQLSCVAHAGPERFDRGGRVFDGHGRILDGRYNHVHFYPAVGMSVRVLPEGYRP